MDIVKMKNDLLRKKARQEEALKLTIEHLELLERELNRKATTPSK